MENEKMISQSTVLSMGWTQRLIEQFLPPPILKPNPHYRCAAPMKLWHESEVLSVMEMDIVKEELEKVSVEKAKATERARKAVNTKIDNAKKLAAQLSDSIEVEVIPDNKLLNKARANAYLLKKTNRRYSDIVVNGAYYFKTQDQETLNRWVVNYIRHNLIAYDRELLKFVGKTGKDEAYIVFKNAILEKIALKYPKYAEECCNQMIPTKKQEPPTETI